MRAAGARRIRPAVAVQTLFVLFGVFIAASFPFLSLFLDAKGLTAGEIGAVIAAMAIARLLLSPLWGHLADTTLGRRRALQIGALGGAVGALVLFGGDLPRDRRGGVRVRRPERHRRAEHRRDRPGVPGRRPDDRVRA